MLSVMFLVCALALTTVKADDPVPTEAAAEQPDHHHHGNDTHVQPNVLIQTRAACPSGWSSHDGHCFKHVTDKSNWADAQSNCQSMGGNLASFHSNAEVNFIKTMTSNKVWIGASDCQVATNWFWIDGTQFDFNFWCTQQPDNTMDQCCSLMNYSDSLCWDDQPCLDLHESICEK